MPWFASDEYLQAPEIPDAIDTLGALRGIFGPMMYLISKARPDFKNKTRHWLMERHFEEKTGILVQDRLRSKSRAIFCNERQEKAGICRTYGITHFIDDRVETINYLVNDPGFHVPNLYLFCFGHEKDPAYGAELPSRVHRVRSWLELKGLLLCH